MTSTEFETWVAYHDNNFKGFKKWIHDDGDIELMNKWFGMLGDWDLHPAQRASDRIALSRDQKYRIFGGNYSDQRGHLLESMQVTAANEMFNTQTDLRYAKLCGMCDGTGIFTAEYTDGTVARTACKTAVKVVVVTCQCDKGIWVADHRKKLPMPMYDRSRMRKEVFPPADPVKVNTFIEKLRANGYQSSAAAAERIRDGKATPSDVRELAAVVTSSPPPPTGKSVHAQKKELELIRVVKDR